MKRKRLFILSVVLPCIIVLVIRYIKTDHIALSRQKVHFPLEDVATSSFCLPISLSLEDLETRLNHELKRVLLSNREIDKSTRITLIRDGNIQLAGQNGRLKTIIPFKVEVHKRKVIELPVITFQVSVNVMSDLRVNSDWSISSTSHVYHYHWREEPAIHVLGQQVKLTDKVEKLLNKEKKRIAQSLDRLVSKKVSLRKAAAKTWRTIQKDHNLLKTSGDTLILKIIPSSIGYVRHEIKPKSIAITLKVDTDLYISSHGALTRHSFRELPDLKMERDSCDGVRVELPSHITFRDLNSSLNRHLSRSKKPIKVMGYDIKSVELKYSDKMAYITLDVGGADEAKLGAQFNLVINSDEGRLTPVVSDIEVLSGNLQTSIAVELLNLYLSEFQETYKGFDYNGYLNQLPSMIENSIANGKSGKMWHPEFSYLTTTIEGIRIDQSGIHSRFNCEGSAIVVVDSLKPQSKH